MRKIRYKGPRGGIKTLAEYRKLSTAQQKRCRKIQWYE